MDAYGALFRGVLFPAWEGVLRGRPTFSILSELRRSEWASEDELAARQSKDLGALLRHAWEHVPFDRWRMEDAGVSPHDVRDVSDLAKIPIVRRRELTDTVRVRSSTVPPFPSITKSTSGTMGTPLTFAYDEGSEYFRQATKLRGYGWAGYLPGDAAVHYWGASPSAPSRANAAKIALDRHLRRDTYVDCGRRDEASLDAMVRTLRAERPRALVCYAQAGADLARHVVDRGLRDWDDVRVLTAAERLFPSDRAVIERAFGPHVFETYGSREVMLIASECEAHDGLHVSMENLVVEIVVTEDGRERPAAVGETGEVVLTDLHNYGMPFVRYANGDLATKKAPGRCACGRSLERLSSVDGRVTESLRDGRGGRVGGLVFNVVIVALSDAIRTFQIVQYGDDSVTLRIVPSARFDEDARAVLLRTAERYLPGLPIRIELVDELPTSASGKRQVVVVHPPS